MAKKGGFKYRGENRTTEEINRRAQQSGGMFDKYLKPGTPELKVRDGVNNLRIMPDSWPDEDVERWGSYWNLDLFLHYGVGPDNATYLCREKMLKSRCPICEAREQSDDDDERDALRPSWRGLCYVIDRDNERAGPQVWSLPVTLFREINERSQDKKTRAPIKIDHPDDGYDIAFSKSGQGVKTKYSGMEVMRDASPLHEDERIQDRWLNYITDNPLPDLLVFYEPEHIEKVLSGRARVKRADDGEEDSRSSRRSSRRDDDEPEERSTRRSSRASSRDEDKDEEEEEDTRSTRRGGRGKDDEREDRRSSRRSSSSSSASKEDDTEEDDDAPWEDEDEDDDKAPSNRRRAASKDDDEGDDGDAEGDEDKASPSDQARSSLERLRNRRRGAA